MSRGVKKMKNIEELLKYLLKEYENEAKTAMPFFLAVDAPWL